MTAEQVVDRLSQENINLTGGRLREGQTEFLVRTVNEFLRIDDLKPIVVDNAGGASVRLEDVARVYKGHKEREIITRIDGHESVEVAVYKEGGTNTVTVSDAVRANLDVLIAELKQVEPSLELSVVTDQARYIRDSVSEVLRTALYGGLLAILVLFFFLRSWKTTAIIGIAIPISVIATFFLMYVSGISLNIMSLGGLTLGIGLLVDNSIVVLEAIQRKRDAGHDDTEAARLGATEVSRAVTASTLTTICVFVPIVFVEGIAGQLFGDQALTVTFSLIISLVVALTIIPMLASRDFAPRADESEEVAAPRRSRAFRLVERGLFLLVLGLIRGLRGIARGAARLVGALFAIPLKLFHGAFGALAGGLRASPGLGPDPPADHRGDRLRAARGEPEPLPPFGPGTGPGVGPGRVLRQRRVASGNPPRRDPASPGHSRGRRRRPRRGRDGLFDRGKLQRTGRGGRGAAREHRGSSR